MYNQVSLYRYFDVEDTLLYVGVSDDPLRRAKEHRSKFWYDKAYRATTEWYPSKVLAHEAERRAIIFENPVFNKKRPRLPANFLAIDPHAVYVADILTDLRNHSDPQTGEICITPEELAGFDAVDVSQIYDVLSYLCWLGRLRVRITSQRVYWVLSNKTSRRALMKGFVRNLPLPA